MVSLRSDADKFRKSNDTRRINEDLTTHAMGYWTKHDDDRVCAYHHRLDLWATSDPTTSRWALECLREHSKK